MSRRRSNRILPQEVLDIIVEYNWNGDQIQDLFLNLLQDNQFTSKLIALDDNQYKNIWNVEDPHYRNYVRDLNILTGNINPDRVRWNREKHVLLNQYPDNLIDNIYLVKLLRQLKAAGFNPYDIFNKNVLEELAKNTIYEYYTYENQNQELEDYYYDMSRDLLDILS